MDADLVLGEERERLVEREAVLRHLAPRVCELQVGPDVELDEVRASVDRDLQRRERVLGRDRRRPTMADDDRRPVAAAGGSRLLDHDDRAVVAEVAARIGATGTDARRLRSPARAARLARRAPRRDVRCRRGRRRAAPRSRRRCRGRRPTPVAAPPAPGRTSAARRCRARGRRSAETRRDRREGRAAVRDARRSRSRRCLAGRSAGTPS